MKKYWILLSIVAGFMWLGSSSLSAQRHTGGIHEKEMSEHLGTYEVRLIAIPDQAAANRLEDAVIRKNGFLSAEVDVQNRLLTVVVKPYISPSLISEVVDASGFEVAKKFTL